MDYIQTKKDLSHYLDIVLGYVETVNWAYVGGAIFIALLLFYIYDSMIGSQSSPWLLVGIMIFLLIAGYISVIVSGV